MPRHPATSLAVVVRGLRVIKTDITDRISKWRDTIRGRFAFIRSGLAAVIFHEAIELVVTDSSSAPSRRILRVGRVTNFIDARTLTGSKYLSHRLHVIWTRINRMHLHRPSRGGTCCRRRSGSGGGTSCCGRSRLLWALRWHKTTILAIIVVATGVQETDISAWKFATI